MFPELLHSMHCCSPDSYVYLGPCTLGLPATQEPEVLRGYENFGNVPRITQLAHFSVSNGTFPGRLAESLWFAAVKSDNFLLCQNMWE